MANFNIGLTGLNVAQQAMSIIGTNIANVATEGYHKQSADIRPLEIRNRYGSVLGGAQIAGFKRHVDAMLEQEFYRQMPLYGEVSQQLMAMQTLETALGDVDGEGLAAAMNRFFTALQELSGQPDSRALREQVIWAADGLSQQFTNLSGFISDLSDSIRLEANVLIEEVNALTAEIAGLNQQIQRMELKGSNANLLRDQRDQAIKELSELVPIQLQDADPRTLMASVSVWGTAVVTGVGSIDLEVDVRAEGKIGVSVQDALHYQTDVSGGRLGALLNLRNNILPEITEDLDAVAREIVWNINRIHVEGLGTHGPLTDATGFSVPAGPIADWALPVTAGELRIRVTDAAGAVTTHTVTIDPATDTVGTVAAMIAALDPANLTASAGSGVLRIQALGSARFDFLPVSSVDTSGLADPAAPTAEVTGVYTGQANQTYTLTVSVDAGPSGRIGVTDGLTLVVRNAAAEVVKVLDVGQGYANGDWLGIEAGLLFAIQPGVLQDGEVITLDAVAESDETGFLAAAGINTFLEGHSAATIGVRDALLDDADLLATSRTEEPTDNINTLRMAQVGQMRIAALDDLTPADAYRLSMTTIGQRITLWQARKDSVESVIQQLENQRDAFSGVDMNDQAAHLIIFEKMFQAMSRLISAQERTLEYLMDILA